MFYEYIHSDKLICIYTNIRTALNIYLYISKAYIYIYMFYIIR